MLAKRAGVHGRRKLTLPRDKSLMQQPFVVKGEVIHPQREAAEHAWSSGLCDCTGDWCSLFSVWCCTPVTTAQLFTRCVT